MQSQPGPCPRCGAALAALARACAACGAAVSTGPDPYLGKPLLGKYMCIERLAVGASSFVYKVQHAKLAQLRAMKILRPELREQTRAVEAFWHEARIAGGLHHPNLVMLHDADALPDATPCTIWELIDGQTLGERVARAPLGPETAALVRGLCGALEEIHRKGLAHLDLVPENVLLGHGAQSLEPRLIDFGEAREFGASGEPLLEPLRIGFSAPEQLARRPVDARADVFSLGALICYAYTGRPPLQPRDLKSYAAELERLDPHTLKILEALPPALRPVVEHCLSPDPARRPADAAALREAVRRAARDSGAMPSEPTRTSALPSAMAAEEPTTQRGAARPAPGGGAPAAHLEAIAGMQRPPIRLGPDLTIGRSEDCAAIIDHPTVSKHHATIRWDGAVYVLEDSRSRNGSSVNGRRVTTPTPLHDGDTVILGEVVFRFRLGPA